MPGNSDPVGSADGWMGDSRIRATFQFVVRNIHRKLERSIGTELRLQETWSLNALAGCQFLRVSEWQVGDDE